MYQINMMYTLNLHKAICQTHLNYKKMQKKILMEGNSDIAVW